MFGLDGLFTGPVEAVLAIKDDEEKRLAIKSVLSAGYSGVITFLFEAGRRKLLGFGPALQQMARAMRMSLQPMIDKGLLVVEMPKDVQADLMDPDKLAQFEGEYNSKTL